MNLNQFERLIVWQKAHQLVLTIYRLSSAFPNEEKYGITSQIRRSTISIAANIVEGYKKRTSKDFRHYLNIAEGSLEETKYYLLLVHDLGFINREKYLQLSSLSDEIGRMLHQLQKHLTTS